jgi:hypothetical protein
LCGGALDVARWFLIFNVANLVLSLIIFILRRGFLDVFILLAMLGGAVFLILGGVMDMSASALSTRIRTKSKDDSKRTYSAKAHHAAQKRGFKAIVLGCILIGESVLISILTTNLRF